MSTITTLRSIRKSWSAPDLPALPVIPKSPIRPRMAKSPSQTKSSEIVPIQELFKLCLQYLGTAGIHRELLHNLRSRAKGRISLRQFHDNIAIMEVRKHTFTESLICLLDVKNLEIKLACKQAAMDATGGIAKFGLVTKETIDDITQLLNNIYLTSRSAEDKARLKRKVIRYLTEYGIMVYEK